MEPPSRKITLGNVALITGIIGFVFLTVGDLLFRTVFGGILNLRP